MQVLHKLFLISCPRKPDDQKTITHSTDIKIQRNRQYYHNYSDLNMGKVHRRESSRNVEKLEILHYQTEKTVKSSRKNASTFPIMHRKFCQNTKTIERY